MLHGSLHYLAPVPGHLCSPENSARQEPGAPLMAGMKGGKDWTGVFTFRLEQDLGKAVEMLQAQGVPPPPNLFKFSLLPGVELRVLFHLH